MKNIDELLGVAKLSELMSNDKKDESKKVLWVLAIIGAVAAVAGIAAVVYKYLSPDYLEDIDDDYDDFDDDFFDEDDEVERLQRVDQQNDQRTRHRADERAEHGDDIRHGDDHAHEHDIRHAHDRAADIADDADDGGVNDLAADKAHERRVREPDSLEDYSGQFKLRIPRSLHRLLAARNSSIFDST